MLDPGGSKVQKSAKKWLGDPPPQGTHLGAQFEKEMAQVWIDAEADIQKNVTERWKTDMNSDSWLSKNVRPLVLIFLVVSTVLMVFIDAGVISFEVKTSWIDLLQLVLITVIGAYFGGRSYEKIKK